MRTFYKYMQQTYSMRIGTALSVILAFVIVLSIIAWGLFSQTFFGGNVLLSDFLWHLFAFTSGLFMVTSPTISSFVRTLIPLALKKKAGKAVVLAFAFSLGSLLLLSAYGFFSGLFGHMAYTIFHFTPYDISTFAILILGASAYILALGEIDLVHILRGDVSEKFAKVFTTHDGAFGAFLLGIFLSGTNLHPSTMVLLADAALKGDPVSGSSLLLMHALGRLVPLLLIVALAAVGISATHWLEERKERMRVLSGWLLLMIGALLFDLGLFVFVQWVGGGVLLTNLLAERWVLALLLLAPLWVIYFLESRRVYGAPLLELKRVERVISRAEKERRLLQHTIYFSSGENASAVVAVEKKLDMLEKKRRILESGLRHSLHENLRAPSTQRLEERLLFVRFGFTVVSSLLVVTLLALFI